MESGFLGKGVLAASLTPAARGGGMRHPGEGDGCDLTLGTWGLCGVGELLHSLSAKLPLTSGDGEQHPFIVTASSLTAV